MPGSESMSTPARVLLGRGEPILMGKQIELLHSESFFGSRVVAVTPLLLSQLGPIEVLRQRGQVVADKSASPRPIHHRSALVHLTLGG